MNDITLSNMIIDFPENLNKCSDESDYIKYTDYKYFYVYSPKSYRYSKQYPENICKISLLRKNYQTV